MPGYAGLAAARRLARTARDAHITVVDARASFVERVRLHQYGVIQFLHAHDLPGRTVPTGRTAAWFEEQIVRGAAGAARP